MKKITRADLLISSCLLLASATAALAHPGQANRAGIASARLNLTPITAVSTKSAIANLNSLSHTTIQNLSLIGNRAVTESAAAKRKAATTTATTTTSKSTTTTPGLPGTTSVTTVPTSSTIASQQVSSVISNDWSSWTGSATGTLTLADVGKLLANAKITGSQAAVLGMIADQMNSDISSNPDVSPAYTQAQALAFVMGTSTSSAAIFATTGPMGAMPYYTYAMSQIASSTNTNGSFNLYGSYKLPDLSGIQQGGVGDCFYLSAIESVLNQNPQSIANMIKENANGTFTVSFPKGPTVTVTLTDSDIADFNIAPNNGCWLAVLGLAENNILVGLANTGSAQTRQEYAITTAQKATPLGVVSDGGYPTQTLGLLTGQSYGAITDSDWRQYFSLSFVDSLLETDLASKTPIGVESTDHALSILSFNPSTQMVTILNPWGVSGSYGASDDPGVMNPWMNVEMTNGLFTISTTQMLLDFYSITAPSSILSSTSASLHIALTAPSVNSAGANSIHLADMVTPQAVPVIPSQSYTAVENSLMLGSNLSEISLDSQPLSTADNSTSTTLPQASGVLPVSYHAGIAADSKQLSTETNAAGNQPVYEACEGTLLVIHDSPVTVHTQKADVSVAAHAAALIMQVGDEVAVANLRDKHSGDISVVLDGQPVVVPQGRVLLLGATEASQPQAIKLSACLDNPQAVSLGKFSNTSAFLGRMSYVFAVRNCPQLADLSYSTVAAERKAAMDVMRAAAAVITIAQGH